MELGYSFDDVLLIPQRSDILPSEVKLKTKLTKNITLNIPIASAAMDTVTEGKLAIAMALEGGIGIIHKNMSIESQAKEVRKVKKFSSWIIRNPITLSPEDTLEKAHELIEAHGYSGFPVIENDNLLVGIITHRDLRFKTDSKLLVKEVMTFDPFTANEGISEEKALDILDEHKIEKLPVVDRKGRLTGLITMKDIDKTKQYPDSNNDKRGRLVVGGAVGPNDIDRVKALVEVSVDVIVVDTAHGHTKNVIEAVKRIKGKFDVDIIAGNVATAEGAESLILAGADAVKVGVGPGSICTTRIVAGSGVPQFSAVKACSKVGIKHKVPIIADGGIRYSGDIAKAIGAGASSVMIGNILAGTEESPGRAVFVGGRKYKQYRGMGSIGAMQKGSKDRYGQNNVTESKKLVAEGIEGIVPFKGTVAEVLYQLSGGLRSALGYSGAKDIPTMTKKAKFLRVSPAGLKESHPHNVRITEEAPNYSGFD